MKINIDIPEDMLEAVDKKCKDEFFSRSEWIRTAVRDKLFVYPQGIPKGIIHDTIPPVTYKPPFTGDVPKPENPIQGWCQLHFEKGKNYPLQKITWEDENGNPLIDNKFACPKCVEKYQNMGRGKLYFL